MGLGATALAAMLQRAGIVEQAEVAHALDAREARIDALDLRPDEVADLAGAERIERIVFLVALAVLILDIFVWRA